LGSFFVGANHIAIVENGRGAVFFDGGVDDGVTQIGRKLLVITGIANRRQRRLSRNLCQVGIKNILSFGWKPTGELAHDEGGDDTDEQD
jgi:hypothetical protein